MARALIGCRLSVDAGTADAVVAVIVETEAYLGAADPASHAFRGPTPRAAIMFGSPGRLYVYLSYGLHHCANVVTEPQGTAGAVLLRAAAVEEGEAVVRARRLGAPRRGGAAGWRRRDPAQEGPEAHRARVLARDSLLRGPGNLCRGLGLTLRDNGADLCAEDGRLAVLPAMSPRPPVAAGPRVGISAATDHSLRFSWAAHPAVCRVKRGSRE